MGYIPAGLWAQNPERGSSLDILGISERFLRDVFDDEGLSNEYIKLSQCGKDTIPFTCLECKEHFFVLKRCDLRICPTCSAYRAQALRVKYIPLIEAFMRKSKGKKRLAFLTLTTINKGLMPKPEEIRLHNLAVKKLVKALFEGGLSANELKGTYLHSHIVIFGHYVTQAEISRRWQKLTGCPIVWIEKVKGNSARILNYVLKYITKPVTYPKDYLGAKWAAQYLKAFHGVRRIHTFGSFYNAGTTLERKRFHCPICDSEFVVIDIDKYLLGWSFKEARIMGMRSYQEIKLIWDNDAQAAKDAWAEA